MTSETRDGYDLTCFPEALRDWDVRHHETLTSTNDEARRLVEAHAVQPPAIILAEVQTAGRGRGQNAWWSAQGNLTVTYIVPRSSIPDFGLLPLLAGLVVRRAMVEVTRCERIALKWPNDLVVGKCKLAGMLCERLEQVDLIGLGVNVNSGGASAPAGLRNRITSLRDQTGRSWELTELLVAVSREMWEIIHLDSESDVHDMIQQYERHHWPTGREVTLAEADAGGSITGRCQGIDAQGRLILQSADTVHACCTGTIVSIGPRIADWP